MNSKYYVNGNQYSLNPIYKPRERAIAIEAAKNPGLLEDIMEHDPYLAERLYRLFSREEYGKKIGLAFIERYKKHEEWCHTARDIQRIMEEGGWGKNERIIVINKEVKRKTPSKFGSFPNFKKKQSENIKPKKDS